VDSSVVGLAGDCLDGVWTSISSGIKACTQRRRLKWWRTPEFFDVLVRGCLSDGALSLAASGFGMSAKRTLFTRFNIPGGRLVEFTLLEFFEDWDGRARE